MNTRPRPNTNWEDLEQSDELIIYEVTPKLQSVIDKVIDGDELTQAEFKLWFKHFSQVITDHGNLDTEALLTSHDWWLRRIEYHSGIEDSKMAKFEEEIEKRDLDQWATDDFLKFVKDFFSITELAVVDISDMA